METSTSVYVWWGFMCFIAVLNMGLLYITYRTYNKRKTDYSPTLLWTRKLHMVMATIYVFGCGFRSYIPRGDVRRIVLVDHWISAIAIGRSVATVAELSLAAQWALMLYEVGRSTGNKTIQTFAKLIVPMLVVAECFSWYACTTGNFFGTIIEESLWGISGAVLVAGFLMARPYYEGAQRKFVNTVIGAGGAYVLYMAIMDVPSYVRKFAADQAAGKQYDTLKQGFIEVATQRNLTHAFEDWKYEMVWMTLYFSLAVWASMIMVNAPRLDKGLKEN